MDDEDLLSNSAQMFAEQIQDDRYKREEAKIALMYAKEQRKELEQVRKYISIDFFHFLLIFIHVRLKNLLLNYIKCLLILLL